MTNTISLPVKALNPLLDNDTINTVWLNLCATHAAKSYPKWVSDILFQHSDFAGATIYGEDLLKGLTVGQVSVMYEYSLAYVNPVSRKNAGQYFTPDDVAAYLASHSKEFDKGVWLDPCSGVGNLAYHLVAIQDKPEKFIRTSLILNDMDPLALFIAKTILFLHFYETDNDLYNVMSSRFTNRNFLTQTLPHYDYVLMNPPYAVASAPNDSFTTKQCKDLYAYFMEKATRNSKGFISVTPQSYTHATKFVSLRTLLLKTFHYLHIYNFDNIPDSIFKGVKFGSTNTNTANSTRASVLVAKTSPLKDYKITPLLRWQRGQRELMFNNVESMLGEQDFSENIFPKNYAGLKDFYTEALLQPQLRLFLASEPTAYSLTVPTTPRYYITASKRPLSRTSFQTLYFPDEATLNHAYLILNSSVMFWWWRVNDGGMTLSKETLLSTPMFHFTQNDKLVKELELGERNNLVSKLNAGLQNENIKHEQKLLEALTETVVGKTVAKMLSPIHNNTDFPEVWEEE